MDPRLIKQLHDTPLDQIPPDQAAAIVRDVLNRKAETTPVEVARFGSAI